MRSVRPRLVRGLLIGLLTVPLLETGACVQIAQDAVIGGFFNVATPLLVARAESTLDQPTADGQADNGDNGP